MSALAPKALIGLFALTVGCSSTVSDGAGAGGTGAQGQGGAGGASSGPVSCEQTLDFVSISLGVQDDGPIGCAPADSSPGETNLTLEGAVVETEANVITLDTCPPNADCVPSIARLLLEGGDIVLPYLGVGQYVAVDFHMFEGEESCATTVMMKNLPSWGGSANPWDDRDTLLLEASENTYQVIAGSPFSIESRALGCGTGEDHGCGIEDSFALVFQSNDGSALDLAMGHSDSFTVNEPSGPTVLQARNLKSWTTGECFEPVAGDNQNWGYWVTQTADGREN